jgi:hypothetical protein
MNNEKSWPERCEAWLDALPVWGKVLVFPVVIPLMFVWGMLAMGLFILLIPGFCVWAWWEHRRFLRKLHEAGRIVCWAEIEGQLKAGQGTLILGQSMKGPIGSAWWVPDGVSLVPEHPLPTYRQWRLLDLSEGENLWNQALPSMEQCHERYLHPDSGSAAWVELPRRPLAQLVDEVPETSVVVTMYW